MGLSPLVGGIIEFIMGSLQESIQSRCRCKAGAMFKYSSFHLSRKALTNAFVNLIALPFYLIIANKSDKNCWPITTVISSPFLVKESLFLCFGIKRTVSLQYLDLFQQKCVKKPTVEWSLLNIWRS